jgi:fatty acid desaturase
MIRWFLILSLLQLVALWKILGRMGFPPWLAMMASIPVINLVMFYYIALTPWPREADWKRPATGARGPGDANF